MSEDPHQEQSIGGSEPGAEKALYLDQSLWHQFADAETIEAFAQSWLGLQALMIGGVASGVVVLMDPKSQKLSPVALWPQGFREGSRFNAVLERAIKERKGVVLRNDTDVELATAEDLRFLLAYPVTSRDELHGVAVVEIFPREQIELQAAMRKLQWGTSWLQNWILRSATEPGERSTQRLQTVMEITALALEEDNFQSAATALVTELATRLRCDRVSVGFVNGTQVNVRALSHSAQFGKEMNLIRSIGAAMGESVDQQAILLYPEPEDASHPILQAHSQLARAHGDSAICTIPFVDQEQRSFGALMLERAVPEPFDEDTVELCDSLAALVGPILEDKRKNDRLLVIKIRDSLWSQVQKLIGPRHSVRKLVSVLLFGLVLFFTFANGQYRVTAKTTLEGEIQRVIVAPFRGFIAEAPVRAGELVKQDQILCRLDDRDLHLEYSKWASEREQYLLEHRRAMAESDLPAMNVLAKKMGQVDAQLALLDEQLSHAAITSPFDGVVVSGGERDTVTELVYGVKQQATARFIARKLFRYFAHLDPSDTVVNALGGVFVAAGMEIASLVRAILLHDEFWGTTARFGLVKSPTEYVASMLRRTGFVAEDMGLRWNMEPMGQTLFDPPSVAGWGHGDYWLGTVSAWARGGFARGQRWRSQEAGLLAGLDDSPDDVAAAQAIFDLFGLEEVSSTTRDSVQRWHRRAYADGRWATVPQGFLVGALCPEFQVY